MKYEALLILLFGIACMAAATACAPQETRTLVRTTVAPNVDKFIDGDTTCYVLNGYGISCVRTDR